MDAVRMQNSTVIPIFFADSFQSSHPISVPVDHPDAIREIFDSISYGKGASVIRMMANFLGLKAFKAGITAYLNKHKFGNAKQVWRKGYTFLLLPVLDGFNQLLSFHALFPCAVN